MQAQKGEILDVKNEVCPGCAQEVDPNPENARLTGGDDESSFLTDLAGSIPGIDEAMSFAEVMRQVTACFSCFGQSQNSWQARR